MDSNNLSDIFNEDIFSSSALDDLEQNIENLNDSRKLIETCNELQDTFTNKLQNTPINDLYKTIFKTELTKLKQTFSDVINRIKSKLNDNIQDVVIEAGTLLELCIDILSCLHSAVSYVNKKIRYEYIKNLPIVTGEILFETFQHCKESDKLYGSYFNELSSLLMNLFKKANETQHIFLCTLNNVIFDISSGNDIDVIRNDILIQTGLIVTGLDIKTAADLWKQFIIFTEKYSEVLSSQIDISVPICFLSTEIISGIDTIIKTEKENDLKNSEKNIKISSFNLKIIIKLCDIFNENLGDSHKKLLDLLITLNRYSVPILKLNDFNSKLADLIQISLFAGTAPLIKHMIADRQFVHCYFSNINKYLEDVETKLAGILLSTSIMSKIVTVDTELRNEWLRNDFNYNIVYIIFNILEKCNYEFLIELPFTIQNAPGEPSHTSSLYEYLMIHTTSVVISTDPKQFNFIEKLLLKNIIETNVWNAMFSADVWCICARYGNEEFCYNQLTSLIVLHQKIQNGCDRPENIFLSHLISRLFSFLTDKYQKDIVMKYPILTHPKLWTTLRIFKYNNNFQLVTQNTINNLIEKTVEDIQKILSKKFTVEEFNEMCRFLELLSTYPSLENNENSRILTQPICKLWALNKDIEVMKTKWYQQFIKTKCSITKSIITVFDSKQLLEVLKNVYGLQSGGSDIKLHIPDILKSLSEIQFEKQNPELNKTFTIIVEIYKFLLNDPNPVIKQKTLEAFDHFVHNVTQLETFAIHFKKESKLQDEVSNYLRKTINESNDYNDYCKKQTNWKFKHKCDVIRVNSEPALKINSKSVIKVNSESGIKVNSESGIKVNSESGIKANSESVLKLSSEPDMKMNLEPQRKKIKFSSDINIEVILERMETDCNLIIDYFKENTTTSDNKIRLKKITDKLNRI